MRDNPTYKYESDWIKKLGSFSLWKSYYFQQKLFENKIKKGEKLIAQGTKSGN